MPNGLSLWKNNGKNILLDAENLFWAAFSNPDRHKTLIPGDALALYEKTKQRLSKEVRDLRFKQELTAIYIDPTDKCNTNCPYCYIPAKVRQFGRSMTCGELDFILAKIARHFKHRKRKQVIIFHASEPLLAKKIIFDAITKYGRIFKFGLQTNGILLEEEDVGFLKKYRVAVGISLDASIPRLHNRLRPFARGPDGSFFKVIRAIDWFNGYPGLNIITTVTKLNYRGLPALVKLLHRKKVPCVLMNPVRFTKAPIKTFMPDQNLMAVYFIKAVNTAMELSKNTKQKIIIGNFANTILAIVAPAARRLMCDISPCGAGRCFFTITASGEIIPCGEFIGLKGFSAGNIFNTSIRQAMGSGAFNKIRSRIVEDINECNNCDFRNICGAPCPAELHSLGTMYHKAVFCEFYKKIIAYAFKLIRERKIKYLLRDDPSRDLEYVYNLKGEQ